MEKTDTDKLLAELRRTNWLLALLVAEKIGPLQDPIRIRMQAETIFREAGKD